MPWGYITEPGTSVSLEAGTLRLQRREHPDRRWALTDIEGIVAAGGVHFTTPALRALLRQGAPLALVSSTGRVHGRLVPTRGGCASTRLLQYRLATLQEARLPLARSIVVEKIWAMRAVLGRYQANYSVRGLARRRLAALIEESDACDDPGRLLGFEGTAGAVYWGVFRRLNRSKLPFNGRSTRPPRDPVNALLSLGYTLLTQHAIGAIEAHGLDPQLGFYHQVHGARPSLALDLIEPLRHLVVDRAVLRLANRCEVGEADFTPVPGGVHVARAAWPRLVDAVEQLLDARPAAGDVPDTLNAASWREWLRRRVGRFRQQLSAAIDNGETPDA